MTQLKRHLLPPRPERFCWGPGEIEVLTTGDGESISVAQLFGDDGNSHYREVPEQVKIQLPDVKVEGPVVYVALPEWKQRSRKVERDEEGRITRIIDEEV